MGLPQLGLALLQPFPCAPRRQRPLLPSGLTTHGNSSSSRNESHRPPRAVAMCPHPSTTGQVVPGPTPTDPPPPTSGLALSLSGTLSWKGSLAKDSLEKARPFLKCASTPCLPGGRTEKAQAGVDAGRWLSAEPIWVALAWAKTPPGCREWPCWG